VTVPRSLWAAALSVVLMVVGAVGPWAKVLFVTIDGTDDGKDGWIVVGAAAVAVIALLITALVRRRWLAVLSVLAGSAAAATAAYDISDINSFGGHGIVSAEWGIYLALAGSIALVLSSIWVIAEVRSPVEEAVPEASADPTPPASSA
jgi:hypothetical protein